MQGISPLYGRTGRMRYAGEMRCLALSIVCVVFAASCQVADAPKPEVPEREGAEPRVGENVASNQAAEAKPSETKPSEATPSGPAAVAKQPPKNLTIAEQRRMALVGYHLTNARKHRSAGDLKAAKQELLEAAALAPDNQVVAEELVSVRKALGEKPMSLSLTADGTPLLQKVRAQRARAIVATHLRDAERQIAAGDKDQARESLRRARQEIDRKKDLDWGDLPARVEKLRTQLNAGG